MTRAQTCMPSEISGPSDATQAHAERRERLRMGARAPAILGRVSRGVFSHSVRRSLTAND